MNKTVITIVTIVGLVAGFIIGHSFFPTTVTEAIASASAPGVTNSNQSIAQVIGEGTGVAGYVASVNGYTEASTCNNDSNDRIITSIDRVYTVLGTNSSSTLATLNIKAATSSDTTTLSGNTNYLLNTIVATSSPFLFDASSTPGTTGVTPANRIWSIGSCVNFISNGTTTGELIFKVNYIKS